MHILLYETEQYRGHLGSVAGNDEDVGLGTGTCNNTDLLPIASGNIGATGSINTGSSNFSVTRLNTSFYSIALNSYSYPFQQYTTTVTSVGSTPIVCTTSSGCLYIPIALAASSPMGVPFHRLPQITPKSQHKTVKIQKKASLILKNIPIGIFLPLMSKALKTKEYIVQQTADLFNQKGFSGTSLSDIENQTRLTKGCIYGNFENKDALAIAVFQHNLNQVNDIVNQTLDKEPTITGKLFAYLQLYVHFNSHPFPKGGCPVLNTAAEADDTHPLLNKLAQRAVKDWQKSISALVQQGIDMGELNPAVNARHFAITMIAMIEGAMLLANLYKSNHYRVVVMEQLKELVIQMKLK